MPSTLTPGTTVERLAADLDPARPADPMTAELIAWLAGSTRFRAFAEAHRDKIRKKLRGATETEARRDVRAELRVAQLLLADRRIDLVFEAYGSGRAGPDFSVTYRGGQRFNLEVTRMRRRPDTASLGWQLLSKLRQLPPSTANAVLVVIEGGAAEGMEVAAAIRRLRARADAKDEPFFSSRDFDGTRGFYERLLRLGAVFTWSEQAAGDERATMWLNGSARIAMPERAARACLACLRAD